MLHNGALSSVVFICNVLFWSLKRSTPAHTQHLERLEDVLRVWQEINTYMALYTVLFYRWHNPPILHAEPQAHPCNEVLMWVHSVPEDQAAIAAQILLRGSHQVLSHDRKSCSQETESHLQRLKYAFVQQCWLNMLWLILRALVSSRDSRHCVTTKRQTVASSHISFKEIA